MTHVMAREVAFDVDDGSSPALSVVPGGDSPPRAGLLLVHENKGLTPYMRGVAEDLAGRGWMVLAPDLLARLPDDPGPDDVTTRLIPMERHVADIRAGLDALERQLPGRPVGMIGFCFGGEAALEAARGRSELAALVSWYGVPPSEAEDIPDPLLVILASDDERVNRHTETFVRQLQRAGKDYVVQSYPRTLHAFHDWSRPERHSPAAAAAAWTQCADFLHQHLG